MGKRLDRLSNSGTIGSIFVREGGCKEDVKTRSLKAAQVFYQLSPILGHKEISTITKTQIIRTDKIRNEEIRRRVNMQPAEQTANKGAARHAETCKMRLCMMYKIEHTVVGGPWAEWLTRTKRVTRGFHAWKYIPIYSQHNTSEFSFFFSPSIDTFRARITKN